MHGLDFIALFGPGLNATINSFGPALNDSIGPRANIICDYPISPNLLVFNIMIKIMVVSAQQKRTFFYMLMFNKNA